MSLEGQTLSGCWICWLEILFSPFLWGKVGDGVEAGSALRWVSRVIPLSRAIVIVPVDIRNGKQNNGRHHECACHPCTAARLIFVYFQLPCVCSRSQHWLEILEYIFIFCVSLSSVPSLPTCKNFCHIWQVSKGLLRRGQEFVFWLLLGQTAGELMMADVAFQNRSYMNTLFSRHWWGTIYSKWVKF